MFIKGGVSIRWNRLSAATALRDNIKLAAYALKCIAKEGIKDEKRRDAYQGAPE